MKTHLELGVAALLMCPLAVAGQGDSATMTSANGAAAQPADTGGAVKFIAFHPPGGVSGGVLPNRVGGGSRGAANNGLSVEALVPKEEALTTQAQPSVYWYQSKPTNNLCEFTLTKPGEAKPLLNLKTSKPVPEGIHAIKLRKYAVALEPDVVYRWTLAIVVDPANRSQDILAEGVIKRVSPSPDLAKALASAGPANEALVYAANGIWVDALQAISEQIESSPKDQALRKARSSLLDQVDLPLAVDETP